MDATHYYSTTVTWNKDRIGRLEVPGFPSLEVATPPQFTGGVDGIWSPEHLYVASAAACLMTTFLSIAENSKLAFHSFSCDGKGKLEKVDGRYQITEIELRPRVTVFEEAVIERTTRILHKSEAACLISNSMKSSVRLAPEVVVAVGEK